MDIAKNFSIEEQYKFYLEKIGLKEEEMGKEQKTQLRETFYAAFGQALIILRDGIGELDDDKAVETMQDLLNQVTKFFINKTSL